MVTASSQQDFLQVPPPLPFYQQMQ